MVRAAIILLITFLIQHQALANTAITGKITDEAGAPLSAIVDINGLKVTTNLNGVFSAQVTDEHLYRLNIGANGFFSAFHTFSQHELETAQPTANQIPTIALVAKKEDRTLMVFGGDAMMGRRYSKPFPGEPVLIRPDHKSADTKAVLKHMKPYLEIADFASVNLETQVIDEEPEAKAPKSVTFFTPPETIDALAWAGIDYVTLGNNHTYDYLDAGLHSTLDNLKTRDMAFSGAGLTEGEALRSHVEQMNGHRYAYQGYVGWAGSAKPSQVAEGDAKGGPPLGTLDKIVAQVSYDRGQDTWPVVQYHGSLEYGDEPSLDTETRLKAAIDAGAVMALGHHPHVFQGLEVYKNKLIAWSLGNFSFDQYFYTAQKTALLYVWMDGERFHRAEVVPIYLKGYIPTPATGQMRHSILKRISKLSARRGTHLTVSGGHGIVQAGGKPSAFPSTPSMLDYNILQPTGSSNRVVVLTNRQWETSFQGVANLPTNTTFRFGRDLLSRGDFEAYHNFGAPDRSWLDMTPDVGVTDNEAFSGARSLKIVTAAQASSITGMRKFTRAYKPGNPTTVSAMVKSTEPVTLVFLFQKRGTRDGLSTALENNPKVELGRVTKEAGDWRQVAVDFISPRVGARSYRILVQVLNKNDESASTFIDDIALVEWQTPLLDSTTASLETDFSHIQFKR